MLAFITDINLSLDDKYLYVGGINIASSRDGGVAGMRYDSGSAFHPSGMDVLLVRITDMSVAGYDGRLDLAPAVQHLLQHLLQLGERRLAGNVVRALHVFFRNQ